MRVLLLFLVACAAGPRPESARWPSHRHHHDEQLEQLEHRVGELEAEVRALMARPPAPSPAQP